MKYEDVKIIFINETTYQNIRKKMCKHNDYYTFEEIKEIYCKDIKNVIK